MRFYIPKEEVRNSIMNELHDSRAAGHLGIKRTIDLVKRDFYWPTLEKDVTEYVNTCDECQRNKPQIKRHKDCCSLWRHRCTSFAAPQHSSDSGLRGPYLRIAVQ